MQGTAELSRAAEQTVNVVSAANGPPFTFANGLARKLGNFVEAHSLGEIYQEAAFQIGTHERIPDLASSQRLALVSEQLLPGGRCPLREIFNQPRDLTT